jgi:transcriptional regulator with XRE-family HTH domain
MKLHGISTSFGTVIHEAAPLPVQLAFGLRSLVLMDGDTEMQRRLAYAIRAAMTAKSWKAPDLARAINRDPSTVTRWVNGDSVPNLLMVKVLAVALDVRPEFLFDPPPVPDYPLSEYLVHEAGHSAVAEGEARARRRRASGDA